MNPPPATPAPGLTLANLTLEKEKSYFTVVLILSVLVWLVLAITIVGILYAALFALLAWLGNGLLTAHLRAETVRVDEQQLPRLHATFVEVCAQLGVTQIPALYVQQAGGILNAFATRFSGRNFVVVYSDMLEAFGPDSAEMRFILGHELGHLKSNHIMKLVLLAPGIFMPLIGPAYLRACEASCDRHGAFAAGDLDGAVRAMLTLGGGKSQARSLDAPAFARQHRDDRGFFVSWHELTSAYPTLSQRVKNLLALRDPAYEFTAPRNPFAYLTAFFTPGGRASGAANMMVFVIIIGLLAAMAIPAFQKVRQTSLQKACLNNERQISSAVQQFELEQSRPPRQLEEFVGPGKLLKEFPRCPAGGTYKIVPDGKGGGQITCSVHGEYAY
jgi:Zn-dependent protease with chaperone function/competence protein ComGC